MLNSQVYYFSLWQYFIKYLSSSPVHTGVLILFLSVKKYPVRNRCVGVVKHAVNSCGIRSEKLQPDLHSNFSRFLKPAFKCYGLRNDGVLRWMRNDETQSTLQIKLSSLKNLRAEGSLRSLFLHIPSPIFLPQSFSPGRKGGGPRTLTWVPGVCVLVVQP